MSKYDPTAAGTTGHTAIDVTATPLGPPTIPAPPSFLVRREDGGYIIREAGGNITREAG